MAVARAGQRSETSPTAVGELDYCRQFVIAESLIPAFERWSTRRLRNGMSVQAHPWLELAQVESASMTLTLLGYLVDPAAPQSGNHEVLASLLARSGGPSDVIEATSGLGGRWALVVETPLSAMIFHDPCGLRQVHYSNPASKERFCASQPCSVASALGLERDERARHEFLESTYVATQEEYWWPDAATPYLNVECLLPNHYLDLSTWTAHRYWPQAHPGRRSLDEAVPLCASLLARLTEAHAARFPLSLPITAGRDSRSLLASARRVAASLNYFTLEIPYERVNRTDLRVSAELLKGLELPHQVVTLRRRVDRAFSELYRRNVEPWHASAEALAYSMWMDLPPGRVSLMGHSSEIGRNFYRFRDGSDDEALSGVARKTEMTGNAFAERCLAHWMKGAMPAADLGYDLWDLLYWEQRDGRWAANGQAQWDVVFESATPFNCRLLLETQLSVDSSERGRPQFQLHQGIMNTLWPEVLDAPLNPSPGRFDPLLAWLADVRFDRKRALRTLRNKGQRFVLAKRQWFDAHVRRSARS